MDNNIIDSLIGMLNSSDREDVALGALYFNQLEHYEDRKHISKNLEKSKWYIDELFSQKWWAFHKEFNAVGEQKPKFGYITLERI